MYALCIIATNMCKNIVQPPVHGLLFRGIALLGKERMAPRAGFEPAAKRLTVVCSTAELSGNSQKLVCYAVSTFFCQCHFPKKYDSPEREKNGGTSRNRTGVRGFAVLCITTLPSRL